MVTMSRICLFLAGLVCVAGPRAALAADAKSREVDAAVSRALKYLQSSQNQDGTWSAQWGRGRNPAITGLAVMAFLSAGHVPGEGPYGRTVERGVRAVCNMQHPSRLIAS